MIAFVGLGRANHREHCFWNMWLHCCSFWDDIVACYKRVWKQLLNRLEKTFHFFLKWYRNSLLVFILNLWVCHLCMWLVGFSVSAGEYTQLPPSLAAALSSGSRRTVKFHHDQHMESHQGTGLRRQEFYRASFLWQVSYEPLNICCRALVDFRTVSLSLFLILTGFSIEWLIGICLRIGWLESFRYVFLAFLAIRCTILQQSV